MRYVCTEVFIIIISASKINSCSAKWFQPLEAVVKCSSDDDVDQNVIKIVASKLSGIGVFAVGNEVVSSHV
jgi:hypothetical protein